MQTLEIKSSIRNYTVEFCSILKIIDKLKKEPVNDYFVIADSFFKTMVSGETKKKLGNRILFIEASEKTKEFSSLQPIIDKILKSGFTRKDKIIAFGGGCIQDVSGFIASTLFRGVEWIFIPTTLVSMCDSCIGGKTSINFGKYKNMIGTFYPPSKIFIDTIFLQTLNSTHIASGIGEAFHYFFLKKDYHMAKWILDRYVDDIAIKNLIHRSLEIKKEFIEQDEFDKGKRQLLNYAHTFAHGIESIMNFKTPHGIAVLKGIYMANWLARRRKWISQNRHDAMKKILDRITTEFILPKGLVPRFIDYLAKDKKNTDGNINFILPVGNGFKKVAIKNDARLKRDLEKYFSK